MVATQYLDALLKIMNVIVLLYAFYKFTKKPGENIKVEIEQLKQKQAELELKLIEVERSLLLGNNNFQALREVVEGITSGVLAIVDFELTYCARTSYDGDMTDLKAAQTTIRSLKKKA